SSERIAAASRLVNHAESGTSSNALTFIAAPWVSSDRPRDSRANTMLSTWSHTNGDTYSRGAQVLRPGSLSVGSGRHGTDTGCRSVSTRNGSRSGNGRGGPAHDSAALAAMVIAMMAVDVIRSLASIRGSRAPM